MKSINITLILTLLSYSAYGLTDTAQLFVDHRISAQGYCAAMLDAVDRQQELINDVRELFAQAQYSFLLDELSEELSRRRLWDMIACLAISEQAYATTTTSSFDQPGTSEEHENFNFSAELEKIFSALKLTFNDSTESIRQKYTERYKKFLTTTHKDSPLMKECMRSIHKDEHDIVQKKISDLFTGNLRPAQRQALRDIFDLAVLSAAIAPEGSPNRAARISTAIFIKEAAARAGYDITKIDPRLHNGLFLVNQKFSPELTNKLRETLHDGHPAEIIRAIILGNEVKLPHIELMRKPSYHNVIVLQKILELAQRAAQEKPDQADRGKIVETIAQRYVHVRDIVAAQELLKQEQQTTRKRKPQENSLLKTDHRDRRIATSTSNIVATTLHEIIQEQETSRSTIANVLTGDTSTSVDAQANIPATMLMTPPGTLYVEDMRENVAPSLQHVLQELDFDFDAEAQQDLAALLITPSDPVNQQQRNLQLPQGRFLRAQKFSPDLNKDLQNALRHNSSTIKAIIVGDPSLLPHIELMRKPSSHSVLALQKILELAQRAAQEKPDQEDRGKIVETIAQRYAHMRDTVAAQELVKQQKSLGKRKYQKGSSIETDHRDQRMATTTSNVLTASLQEMMQEQETSKSTIANVLAGDTSTPIDICVQTTNTLATMLMTPPGTLYVEDIQENVNPSVLHVLQELDFDFDAGAQQNLAAMLVTPSDPIATPHDTQH